MSAITVTRAAESPPAEPASRPRRWGALRAFGWRAFGVIVFVATWQLVALVVDSRAVLPGPTAVLEALARSWWDDPGLSYLGVSQPSYLVNIGWTVGFAAAAWAVGSALGACVGLASGRMQWVRNLSEPLLFVFGAVPALVLAPFFLVWFGQGWPSKVVLVGFYCFVSVGLVAQSAALKSPRVNEEYAATLGISARDRFRRVVVPGAVPAVLAGLRIALATAIAVQATVELLGSQRGAGRLIALRASQGDVAAVLGLSIALGIVAVVLDAVLRVVIRRAVRWQ